MNRLQSPEKKIHILVVGIAGLESYDALCRMSEQLQVTLHLALTFEEAVCFLQQQTFHAVWVDAPSAIITDNRWIHEMRTFHRSWIICSAHEIPIDDEICALQNGVDACMCIAESEGLVNARRSALIRRIRNSNPEGFHTHDNGTVIVPPQTTGTSTARNGALIVGTNRQQVTLSNKTLELNTSEFELLRLLVRHQGTVLHRDFIHRWLIGTEWDGIDRSVDQRIVRLRKKLGDNANAPTWIVSVRGAGYKMNVFN